MASPKFVPAGGRVGILGGGQLGRMLALAAAELGFDAHIFTPEDDSPASRVAARTVVAPYENSAAVADFAKRVDVLTYEFENIPVSAIEAARSVGCLVAPGPQVLAITQDRAPEKQMLNQAGAKTVTFALIDSTADVSAAIAKVGLPAILKTRRFGYDGKGQAKVSSEAELRACVEKFNAPCILEALASFTKEFSIIAARTAAGAFAAYDAAENEHGDHILRRTVVPASAPAASLALATDATRNVLDKLDYVGVAAIEFFLMPDGSVLANEMAPRVHNSGHWTQDACITGQFEQHIRAICGWPLGATQRFADAEMFNLIGDEIGQWPNWADQAGVRVHLYGKREARPGRKMGHVTKLSPLRG
ncbi:MAG: 5-(carboxyamino)imidazole ribonucleotide synthase [Caulobacterales bacterium]